MSMAFELVTVRGPSNDPSFRELRADLEEGLDFEALIDVFEEAAERWPGETVAAVFHGDMDDWLLMVASDGAAIETFLDFDSDGQLVDPTGEYAELLRELGPIDVGSVDPVEPPEELPEPSRSDNPLRRGTRSDRIALAKKADAMPSRANLAHLVEARFAPEHRDHQLAELRRVLDRAISRHDESAIAKAIDEVLEHGEATARAELRTFVDSTDGPAATLRALADG